MNNFGFVIEGSPVAKGRPRFSNRGGFAKAYTPAKTRNAEAEVIVRCINAMKIAGNDRPTENPLKISIFFDMPIPKSFSKKKVEACLRCEIFPTTRPDLDNMAKTYLDAMNGIVYKDDSQIIELNVKKKYSTVPATTVYVVNIF